MQPGSRGNSSYGEPTVGKRIIVSQSTIPPVESIQRGVSGISSYSSNNPPQQSTFGTTSNIYLTSSPIGSQTNLKIPSTTFVNANQFQPSPVSRFGKEALGEPVGLARDASRKFESSGWQQQSDISRPSRTPDRVIRISENTASHQSVFLPQQENASIPIQRSIIINPHPMPATAEDINRLADTKDTTKPSEQLDLLSKEELIMRLENALRTIQEYKNIMASLKVDGGENANYIRQIQNLTNEVTGLKEQIFKLKNLANDDLVILEKAVTTEVYGKKSQIAIELEEAKKMKADYERLQREVQEKEVRIHTFEKEIVEMKTVIDRTNNDISAGRFGGPNLQEFESLKRELQIKNSQLQARDQELGSERSKSNFLSTQISNLQRDIDGMKQNPPASWVNSQISQLRSLLDAKQNEINNLNERLLNQPATVRYQTVIPQDVKQNLEQLKTTNLQKDNQIENLNSELMIIRNQLRDAQNSGQNYQRQLFETRAQLEQLKGQSEREFQTLREQRTNSELNDSERFRLNRQLMELRNELKITKAQKDAEIASLREQRKGSELMDQDRIKLNRQVFELKNELEIIRTQKDAEISNLRDQRSGSELGEAERLRLNKTVADLRTEFENLRQQKDSEINALRERAKNSEMGEAERSRLTRQITELKNELDSLHKQKESEIAALRENRKGAEFGEAERSNMALELKRLRNQLSESTKRVLELEGDVAQKTATIKYLNDDLRTRPLADELLTLRAQIQRLESTIDSKNKQLLEKDAQLNSKLDPNSLNELQFAKSRLEDQLNSKEKMFRERESDLRNKLDNLESENAKLRSAASNFEFKLKEKSDLIDEKTREYRKLKDEIANFKNMDLSNIDLNKIPSELSNILIEQLKQKLESYKQLIDRYQQDIEKLKKELQELQARDLEETVAVRGKFEKSQALIDGLNRDLTGARKSAAEFELENQRLNDLVKSLRAQMDLRPERSPKSPNDEDLLEKLRRESLAKLKELRDMYDREVAENNTLRDIRKTLEQKVDQSRKHMADLEEQRESWQKELDRLGAANRSARTETDTQIRKVEELQQRIKDLGAQEEDRKEKIKNQLKKVNINKQIIERIIKNINEKPLDEALQEMFEHVSGEKKKTQNEGSQTFVFRNEGSAQTDERITGLGANALLNLASKTDGADKSVKDDGFADIKSKMEEQMQTNQRLDAKVGDLHRENDRLREKIDRLKQKNTQIQSVKETLIKEREVAARPAYDPRNVDDLLVKPLRDEVQRLKNENGDLKDQLTVFRERQVKKKKAILNEICNFVTTKNNYEQALINEVSRVSEVNIVVNEREDVYQQF